MTNEEFPQHEIDMEWVAQLLPFGMMMATKMHREEEVQREHLLAELARDYLVAYGVLDVQGRDQIQMEVLRSPCMLQVVVANSRNEKSRKP